MRGDPRRRFPTRPPRNVETEPWSLNTLWIHKQRSSSLFFFTPSNRRPDTSPVLVTRCMSTQISVLQLNFYCYSCRHRLTVQIFKFCLCKYFVVTCKKFLCIIKFTSSTDIFLPLSSLLTFIFVFYFVISLNVSDYYCHIVLNS